MFDGLGQKTKLASIGKTDMHYSPESLEAFAQAAALGSFSAAARKLGKSQSTVSEAIARLEIDLGIKLFDRNSRQPVLTAAGQRLLADVRDILHATDRLSRTASQLLEGVESKLSLVVSDVYHSGAFEALLVELDQRFPNLEFECIDAQHGDVISLVSQGRADMGLLATPHDYPPEIGFSTLSEQVEFGLYAVRDHPLTRVPRITYEHLSAWRGLCLETLLDQHPQKDFLAAIGGVSWTSSSYLILLEMAMQGFGWAELPGWMVERYAAGSLQPLSVAGWPRYMAVDVIWSRSRSLGVAGNWLRERVTRG